MVLCAMETLSSHISVDVMLTCPTHVNTVAGHAPLFVAMLFLDLMIIMCTPTLMKGMMFWE